MAENKHTVPDGHPSNRRQQLSFLLLENHLFLTDTLHHFEVIKLLVTAGRKEKKYQNEKKQSKISFYSTIPTEHILFSRLLLNK